MLVAALFGVATLSWSSGSQAAADNGPHRCEVIGDNGKKMTRIGRDCNNYYSENHYCGKQDRRNGGIVGSDTTMICGVHDMFKVVNWDSIDMIINTHRGIWGMDLSEDAATRDSFTMTLGGAPENSYAGVAAAQRAGFKSVEYDIILMRSADGNHQVPVVNHYLDLRGFTSYGGPQRIPATGVSGAQGFLVNHVGMPDVLLRNRAGVVAAADDDNKLKSVLNFLSTLKYRHPGVVVVFDVKWAKQLVQIQQRPGADGAVSRRPWCIGFCNEFPKESAYSEVVKLINLTLRAALQTRTLRNIIIKIPQLGDATAEDLRRDISLFEYVQWAPQPLVGLDKEGKNMDKVLDYVDGWINDVGIGYISFWDTTIYSTKSWMGRSFVRNGIEYVDLMDYLRRRSDRRASIWAPDPAGPGGRNGNYAMTSTNYGNSDDDTRGDLLSNFVYSQSMNAVISTDRPDIALEIRNDLSSASGN